MLQEGEYSPQSEKYICVCELLYFNLLQYVVLTRVYDIQAAYNSF